MKVEIDINEETLRNAAEKAIIKGISNQLTIDLKDVLHVMVRRECECYIKQIIGREVEKYVNEVYFTYFRDKIHEYQDGYLNRGQLRQDFEKQVNGLLELVNQEDKEDFLFSKVAVEIAHLVNAGGTRRNKLAKAIIELSQKEGENE